MLYATANEAYIHTLETLLAQPTRTCRVGEMREVLNLSMTIDNPHSFATVRRFSPIYAAAELMWYLSFDNRGDMILHYAPSYSRFLEQDALGTMRANGGYGLRMRWQFPRLITHILNKFSENTRQAVISIYSPDDLGRVTSDTPCTLTLQFLPRDGFLHMITNMRSNDAWLGMPYDLYCFTRLLILVAASVDLKPGKYHHNVGSMHLYEKDVDKAYEVLGRDHSGVLFDKYNYAPNLLNLVQVASSLEHRIRAENLKVKDVESILGQSVLLRHTMFPQLLVLCAMQNDKECRDSMYIEPAIKELLV